MAARRRRAPRTASPLRRMAAATPMLALTSCCARWRSCGASTWRRRRVRGSRASCRARTGNRCPCPLPAGSRASSCNSDCTHAVPACSSSADGARRASSESSPRPPSPPLPALRALPSTPAARPCLPPPVTWPSLRAATS
eukprot:scaffold51640_cov68-Phaeocystis_antarctica.AAC.9